VVLRMAALPLATGQALLRGGRPEQDERVRAGIEVAAGSGLLEAAAHDDRAKLAVHRYVSRMSNRPTPFGLFAAAAAVPIAEETRLRFKDGEGEGEDAVEGFTARAWLDADVFQTIVSGAMGRCDEDAVPLRRNPTMRLAGGAYRYRLPGDETADVVELRATPIVAHVLAACDPVAANTTEIVKSLADEFPTVNREDLRRVVRALADRGVLLPDAGLIAPGTEPGDVVADFLRRCGLDGEADTVERVGSTIASPRATEGYLAHLDDAWNDLTARIPGLAEVPSQFRFHVEMQANVEGTIGRNVLRSLERAVMRLEEVYPPVDMAGEFFDRFQERYGDATVPLLEAADPERGVLARGKRGRSGVVAGLSFGAGGDGRGKVSSVQLAALDHFARTGTPYDLGAPAKDNPGSDCLGLIASLIGPSGAPMTTVLHGGSHRSPGAFIARFSAGRGELTGRLREQVRAVSIGRAGREDVISAEVAYHPGGRIGNVLVRPALCDETVALSGGTGGTLSLDRLLLRVEGPRIAVYDAVTGRPVVLFVSSAHGTEGDHLDPLYWMLANIGARATWSWLWGPLTRMSHLPRISCGDVVVGPETWRVEGASVREAVAAKDPAGALRALLPGLGERMWVGIGPADEKLAIDTTSARSVTEVLSRHLKENYIQLTEMPHVEHPAVTGRDGEHVGEIIVGRASVRRRRADPSPHCAPLPRPDWVYFQYFSGVSSSDSVVARAAQLARRLRDAREADLWFFIRYGEGGNHIRVRMRAASPTARAAVMAAMDELGAGMLAEGAVTSYRADQYLPEGRRYGGPEGMPAAERLFTADSDDIAARIVGDPSEEDRLIAAACDVYAWWRVLAGGPLPSIEAMRRAQQGVAFGGIVDRKIIGKIARGYRPELDRRFKPDLDPAVDAELARFLGTVSSSWGERYLTEVMASVVHMHCNRLFAFDPRRMEYLAYALAIQKAIQAHALAPAASVIGNGSEQ